MERNAEKNAIELTDSNPDGDTRLGQACRQDSDLSLIQELVEKEGYNPNQANTKGHTPFELSCRFSTKPEVIAYLIEQGCNLQEKGKTGYTAFEVACAYNPSVEVIQYMHQKCGCDHNKKVAGARFSPFTLACRHNPNLEVIKYLVEKGGDINQVNEVTSETILHRACVNKNPQVIKYLIKNVEEKIFETKNSSGHTALETLLLHLCKDKNFILTNDMKEIVINFLLKGPKPSQDIIPILAQDENNKPICELLACSRGQLLVDYGQELGLAKYVDLTQLNLTQRDKKSIETFLLVLKRQEKEKHIKVPKAVVMNCILPRSLSEKEEDENQSNNNTFCKIS